MVGWANVGDWLVGPTVSNSVGPTLGNGWLGNRKKECQSVPLANRGWQRWANCMPTTCATRDEFGGGFYFFRRRRALNNLLKRHETSLRKA
ncbi:hypothetical protein AVEN_207421-1 [Araneus ventricosus]|uniref:Uncharacterized protein n=1 Tax=Araneus ventricosus TaxID=182803 RepID=A0A4Y2VAL6_ARAVE|nr:hypothetical protein AVEN_207421-1 [Araneus ventricosus]